MMIYVKINDFQKEIIILKRKFYIGVSTLLLAIWQQDMKV